MPKSVRVHEDTHRALKEIKGRKRSKSIDEVIREMIRTTMGTPVEKFELRVKNEQLTRFLESAKS